MAAVHSRSNSEDANMSEDSESTQDSTDLDYDVTIDVLMPDNTVKKTNIVASTPWSDVRTQLYSQLKLTPSSHVIDFISKSNGNKFQRKASRAIGKMDVGMITIQAKGNGTTKHVTPHPVSSNKENTVRLIVRLARIRQSIIRVNPDVPLKNIFTIVGDKLNLNEEAKKQVELRHPVQTNVKLDPDLSLNHYNLREVYLVDKKSESSKHSKPAPPPPTKTKRKAPLPPQRTPSGDSTPQSQSPAIQHRDPPAVGESDKKPVPAKRRAAPPPPQSKPELPPQPSRKPGEETRVDIKEAAKPEDENQKDSSSETTVAREPSEDVQDATNELDQVLNDITSEGESSHDDADSAEEVVEDEVTIIEEKVSETAQDEKSVDSDTEDKPDSVEDVDPTIGTISTSDPLGESTNVATETKPDDVTIEVVETDKVVKHEAVEEIVTTESKQDTENNGMKYGDIIVYDVSDDDVTPEMETEKEAASSKDMEETIPLPADVDPPSDLEDLDLPPPPPSLLDDDETLPAQVPDLGPSIPAEDPSSSHHEQLVMPDLPPELAEVSLEEEVAEKLVIKETSSIPSDQSKADQTQEETIERKEDNFDLHVAESLNIPLEAIGEGRNKADVSDNRKEAKVDMNSNLVQKNEDELSESDETAKEIEKLHRQIKKMRDRNSVKQSQKSEQYQKMKESNRNSWHPGTKSFTFVPNQKQKLFSHQDYEVAPVGGIELSNSGEIKGINDDPKKSDDVKVEQTAPKLRSTLPSYYKKFLGVNAFAAKDSKK
ncbi:uncharacterized protein LOC143468922 [Clavelina lepadiformis]|uniref:uncharacterized protein LOC143468922 n=1 Tax=Clavelina lepadiformis TaxID=159417 RepID=UPI004042F750